MSGNTYKMLSPTVAHFSEGEKQVMITIPKGAIITVLGPLGDRGFVDIRWENNVVKMFIKDLRERAVLL